MSRSVGLNHIIRQDDGTSVGVWGVHTLRSAFQPIFAFGPDGKLSIAAFEGLIRPFRDGEPVSPGAFFGNVPPPDRFHVETLTRTLHILNASACLDAKASLFVNFDPSLFSEQSVVDVALRDMRLVLHEAGIAPARVVCEVTEQKASSTLALLRFIESLKRDGFRIAVDDYGSHESDIKRIEELKPHIVKFDAYWITRLMESGPGFALLEAMVRTFAAQGIQTVFEGIEEGWQLELAEKSGASMVQGYVLARPEIAPTRFSLFTRPDTEQAEALPGDALHPLAAAMREAVAPSPAGARRPSQPHRAFGRRGSSA